MASAFGTGARPSCAAILIVCWLVVLVSPAGGQEEDFSDDDGETLLDDAWYNADELPNVDLEGLIANLSAQISWFKYVGNVTLRCADLAKQQDTLMLAIENLHGCLQESYRLCASEFAEQTGCRQPAYHEAPCGTMRLGERYPSRLPYQNDYDCTWYLAVPVEFVMNFTVDEFDMEFSGDDCPWDYMEVWNGNSTLAPYFGRWCGRHLTFTLYGTTHQMTVKAHTDPTIGKVGFRAVYQVMDPLVGQTLNEVTQIREGQGQGTTFTLDNILPEMYDTYHEGWYYYKIFIRVDWLKTIQLTVNFEGDVNATLTVYNGPLVTNNQLISWKQTASGKSHMQKDTVKTDGFVALIEVKRKNMTDATNMTGYYESVDMENRLRTVHTIQECIGPSDIDLQGDETEFMIGVANTTKLTNGKPILCYWNAEAPPGYQVEMEVQELTFEAPTTNECYAEGLQMWDGIGQADETSVRRLGPFCYSEPRGFLVQGDKGVNGVTSSGRKLLVSFYSYMNYPSSTSKHRGNFKAIIRRTKCKGIINPCSSPMFNTNDFYSIKLMEGMNITENHLEMDFSCNKSECCVLQQFPTLAVPTVYPQCSLRLTTMGKLVLATSVFVTQAVQGNKPDNLTWIKYACEKKRNIRNLKHGPSRHACMGTSAHLQVYTNSSWSTSAFAIRIQQAPCGFYRPDMHSENTFYPPCAQAEFPASPKRYEVYFKDLKYHPRNQYWFSVEYVGKRCQCLADSLELIAELDNGEVSSDMPQKTSMKWDRLQNKMFGFMAWGGGANATSWNRKMIVIRKLDSTKEQCQNVSKSDPCGFKHSVNQDGELIVKFNSTQWTTLIPEPDEDVDCPDGYQNVDGNCYTYFPKDFNKKRLAGLSMGHSAENATEMCNDVGGHPMWLSSREESMTFRAYAYYYLYPQILQYIPGVQSIILGIKMRKDDRGRFVNMRWVNDVPVTFMRWNKPDFEKVRFTKSAYNDATVDAIRSDSLRNASELLMPSPEVENGECTVMLFTYPANQDEPPWVNVPCDEVIPGSVVVCKAKPIPKQFHYPRVPPKSLHVATVLGRSSLRVPEWRCPYPFMAVGSLCLTLHWQQDIPYTMTGFRTECESYYKVKLTAQSKISKVLRWMRKTNIPHLASERGLLDDEHIDILKKVLPSMKAGYETGKIMLQYTVCNVSNPAEMNSEVCRPKDSDCHYLEPMMEYEDAKLKSNPRVTWALRKSKESCNTQSPDDLNTAICMVRKIPVEEVCENNHFTCDDGSCVALHHLCDGKMDCMDGSDEADCKHACQRNGGGRGNCFHNCRKENCKCGDEFYQCESGGCIPIAKVCDQVYDCPDKSDELVCKSLDPYPCGKGSSLEQCDNRQCILPIHKCDGISDCLDGSDESNTTCPNDNNNPCVLKKFKNDMMPDCSQTSGLIPTDEKDFYDSYLHGKYDEDKRIVVREQKWPGCGSIMASCDLHVKHCFNRNETCIYKRDRYNMLANCRNGLHLEQCADRDCGHLFKCPGSYCLDTDYVCDGHPDCPNGEDEATCKNFYCKGFFRCKGVNHCISHEKVCNNIVECPQADDEALCDLREAVCPKPCTCFPRGMSCDKSGLTIEALDDVIAKVEKKIRALILRNNELQKVPEKTRELKYLHRLDLSHNSITTLENYFDEFKMLVELNLDNNLMTGLPTKQVFEHLNSLRVLSLRGNMITHIPAKCFYGLTSIRVFDFSHQEMRNLEAHVFSGMDNLESLDLSYNHIEGIVNRSFLNLRKEDGKEVPFHKLKYMDIRRNIIKDASVDAFQQLPKDMFLISDRYKFCCFSQVKRCKPDPDEFSSCSDLISNPGLRMLIWCIGMLAVIGNVIILHQRMKHEKETAPSLLVQHLSFADLLMGIYLLIIASADQYYKSVYIYHVDTWRSHALCRLGGFLSMMSCEMSCYIVMLISVDRMYACVPGCGGINLSVRSCRGLIALGWTITAIISVIPILEFSYFGEGFVRTGVCSTFNITKGKRSGWEFSMAIFIVINTILVGVSGIGYFVTYRKVMMGVDIWTLPDDMEEEDKEYERQFRKNEIIISRRLVAVVVTNFAIWTPLIFVAILSLLGHQVSDLTTAWITLFIMPLNSALNPYLYSFSTRPYRIPVDELLANWTSEQEAEEEEEEEEGEKGETDMGDSSVGASTVASKNDTSITTISKTTASATVPPPSTIKT